MGKIAYYFRDVVRILWIYISQVCRNIFISRVTNHLIFKNLLVILLSLSCIQWNPTRRWVWANRIWEFSSWASFEQEFCHSIFEPSEFEQNFFEQPKVTSKNPREHEHIFSNFCNNWASKTNFLEQILNYSILLKVASFCGVDVFQWLKYKDNWIQNHCVGKALTTGHSMQYNLHT